MMITLPPHEHCVYQLISREGSVIYVGSSSAIFARLAQHAKTKDWWTQVAAISVEAFLDKDRMLDREQELIKMLDPIYNDTYAVAPALVAVSMLLGETVTRGHVRDFLRARMTGGWTPVSVTPEPELATDKAEEMEPEPTPAPSGITLRAYAEEIGMPLSRLTRWRERRDDFPSWIAIGPRGVHLFDRDHLQDYVRARVSETVSALED
jgi:hypothetical protein